MSDKQTAFDFATAQKAGDCPACCWDRVPARAFQLCGHPTLTDDETIRSPLHECPVFRPHDNAGKPLNRPNTQDLPRRAHDDAS